jgi:hypothetical protein
MTLQKSSCCGAEISTNANSFIFLCKSCWKSCTPSQPEPPKADTIKKLIKYLIAQRDLTACYRIGKRPSEALLKRLDGTQEFLNELAKESL